MVLLVRSELVLALSAVRELLLQPELALALRWVLVLGPIPTPVLHHGVDGGGCYWSISACRWSHATRAEVLRA
ncbi:MAG: hypothetical protein HKN60_07385 [Rhizobiales bacterium]|nr:hypothetical protein [Hyphomicrobiales bacterium]